MAPTFLSHGSSSNFTPGAASRPPVHNARRPNMFWCSASVFHVISSVNQHFLEKMLCAFFVRVMPLSPDITFSYSAVTCCDRRATSSIPIALLAYLAHGAGFPIPRVQKYLRSRGCAGVEDGDLWWFVLVEAQHDGRRSAEETAFSLAFLCISWIQHAILSWERAWWQIIILVGFASTAFVSWSSERSWIGSNFVQSFLAASERWLWGYHTNIQWLTLAICLLVALLGPIESNVMKGVNLCTKMGQMSNVQKPCWSMIMGALCHPKYWDYQNHIVNFPNQTV